MKFLLLVLSIPLFLNGSGIKLPEELLYKGKPILDFAFFYFVDHPDKYELNDQLKDAPTYEKITFEWEYLGSYHGKYHAVKTYYWEDGAMGKFTQILLLKREGEQIEVFDVIYGGDRHSSMIFGEVDGDKLLYWKGMTSGGFMEIAVGLFPDIEPLYARSSRSGLCYGEACYFGVMKYSVDVTLEGKFENHLPHYFTGAEGDSYSGKKYQKDELKVIALEVLRDIDYGKPEEFKEDGVAFSPVCFEKLLKKDLKGIDMGPQSIDLLFYKDAPTPFFHSFTWSYIGKIKQYHLIRASTGYDSPVGIYTVCKEGNTLKKVARIAYEEKSHPLYDIKVKGDALVYLQKATCESLFHLLGEKFPECLVEANKKVWSESSRELSCGFAKMELQILDDGTLGDKTLIGFKSSGDPLREERELAAQNNTLLPMDKALLFTGCEVSNPYEFDRLLSEDKLKDFFQKALLRSKNKG